MSRTVRVVGLEMITMVKVKVMLDAGVQGHHKADNDFSVS